MKTQENFVTILFQELNKSGIKYSIIKGYEEHPYYKNDIDIIIDPSDEMIFINIVRYSYGTSDYKIKIDRESGGKLPGQEAIIIFLVFNESSDKRSFSLLRIELFQGIYLAKGTLLSFKEILETRQYCRGINAYIMSREHEALVLFMSIHKKMKLNPKVNLKNAKFNNQIKKLKSLIGTGRNKIDNILRVKFGRNAVKAMDMLENKKFKRFKVLMNIEKILFIKKLILTAPRLLIRTIYAKSKWDINRLVFQKYSFLYSYDGNANEAKKISGYLLKKNIFRDVIVCRSQFALISNIGIRKRRACEAVIILCDKENTSKNFVTNEEVEKLIKAFLNFNSESTMKTKVRKLMKNQNTKNN